MKWYPSSFSYWTAGSTDGKKAEWIWEKPVITSWSYLDTKWHPDNNKWLDPSWFICIDKRSIYLSVAGRWGWHEWVMQTIDMIGGETTSTQICSLFPAAMKESKILWSQCLNHRWNFIISCAEINPTSHEFDVRWSVIFSMKISYF